MNHEVEAGVALCDACLQNPAPRKAGAGDESGRPFLSLGPRAAQDPIVTRSMLMLTATMNRLRIHVDCQFGQLPTIQGAGAELNQVFLDLLANSAGAIEDAGRSGGRIIVTTRRHDDKIEVEVRDNGCGIGAEALTKIFDPFFRVRAQGSGMGLGLSVSHGIVTRHGGRIEVTSEPGHGSCFRVNLPIKPTLAKLAHNPEAPAERTPVAHAQTILES